MAWSTPPTFTVGENLTAALQNQLSGDLTVLATQVGLFGQDAMLTGSSGGVGTPLFLIQAGSQTVNFNSGSGNALTFPSPFPNGLLAIVCMSEAGANASSISLFTASKSAPILKAWNGAVQYTGGNINTTYIAIGT